MRQWNYHGIRTINAPSSMALYLSGMLLNQGYLLPDLINPDTYGIYIDAPAPDIATNNDVQALCIRRTRTDADGRGRTRTDADGRGHLISFLIFFFFFFFFFFFACIDLRAQLERDPESDRLGHPPPPTHHDPMKIYRVYRYLHAQKYTLFVDLHV